MAAERPVRGEGIILTNTKSFFALSVTELRNYAHHMEWNDLPSSPLMRLLREGKLQHPTNNSFDEEAWKTALDAINEPTPRDLDLAVAAIHYGREILGLKAKAIPSVVEGFSRPRLIRLLAAYANYQYLTLRKKARRQARLEKRKSGILDLERAQQQFVSNAGGQEMPADDYLTTLVDCLPHWLFHIWKVSDEEQENEPTNPWLIATKASLSASIEHSVKRLWMHTLWMGNGIRKVGDGLVEGPLDRPDAERWFIWDLRQRMLHSATLGLEAGARIIAGGRLPPVVPVNARTVIRIERPPGVHRRFIIGNASGAKEGQRDHVTEREMLEGQYVSLFLDEALPKSPRGEFTCRLLSRAWWVLRDIATLVANELDEVALRGDGTIERLSFAVERGDLAQAISNSMDIELATAEEIVGWFTCDPSDPRRLFADSFWTEPLLPIANTNRLHAILAPILVGAPVKRIEAWMEKGGISDSNGVKGRGKPFERHVRRDLAEALAVNDLLHDAAVSENGLKRRGTSEEIDLLMRVGSIVIVGEVKCFVAPSEPLERRNHLENLSKATQQAAAKHAWAEENRDKIGIELGVSEAARLAQLRIVPLVVINNGFGIGLERHGVPVVDLHYLMTLLSGGSYMSGSRFERDVGAVRQYEVLYRSQEDLEARIWDLLRDPPPLRRYRDGLRWRRVPFPTSTGRPFMIELPAISEEPMPNPLRDLPRANISKELGIGFFKR